MPFFLMLTALAVGCADGPCRQLKHPELAQKQNPAATKPTGAQATSGVAGLAGTAKAGETPAVSSQSLKPAAGHVLVAKADGSLQCGTAKGQTVEEMEKLLEGIQVFSRENRSDGKMHMQVCGSPTGRINVYEIPASSLKDAEKRGFKKFEG